MTSTPIFPSFFLLSSRPVPLLLRFGLLESMLTIKGRKFTKRSKEIGPTLVMSCVRLLGLLVQRLAGLPAEEAAVQESLAEVLGQPLVWGWWKPLPKSGPIPYVAVDACGEGLQIT